MFNNVSVVLVNPINEGNVGAIARAMANFDFANLIIVGDLVINDEARNRAKHANHILDKVVRCKSFDDARQKFDVIIGTTGIVGTDYNVPRSPLLVEEAVVELSKFSGSVGLIFGPEDKGLSNEELSLCDFVINIPCSDNYGVMNLSHSATVIFYEFFKSFNTLELRKNHVLASVKEKDVTYALISKILDDMSFRAESDRETQRIVWRRVLGKSFITKREISSLMGFFRNVDYSIEKNKKN